jgi:transcriptional regulator with XRE-family HTH domain
MYIAQNLKNIRKSCGHSQEEMAQKLKLNRSTYSGYESEAGNLSYNTIHKIAEALGCDVLFLLDVNSDCYDEETWKTLPKS